MKNEIPKEYPGELDDDELLKLIKDFSIRATVAGRSESYAVGPSYWKEIAELGLIEVSIRIQKKLFGQIAKLTTEISVLKDDNKKSGRINVGLSIITIILAVITGYLGYQTVDDSKNTQKSEIVWRSSQLDLLRKHNSELQNIKAEIIKVNLPKEEIKKIKKK